MLTPSSDIIQLLDEFAPAMTAPTFAKWLDLIYGAVMAVGKRTVSSALRIMGKAEESNPGKYHRVFSQARWSPFKMSRILLALLVLTFVPDGSPIVILVDETLERRAGKKIVYKGWFRDAVRSVGKKVAFSRGIRWCCMSLLVHIPGSSRPWALPFMAVPVLSEKTCQRLKKTHRSGVKWAAFLIEKVHAWYPDRKIVLVGDGGYSAIELIAACQHLEVTLVSRIRADAKLYDFPAEQPSSKRGPKPKKGKRLPSLADILADPQTKWSWDKEQWDDDTEMRTATCTDVCLWHTDGQDPVAIRWTLVRHEEKEKDKKTGKETITVRTASFFCSDAKEATITADTILGWYGGRWNIEVTFEEMRAHLGLETQRHWSVRAVERTTPCLFGLFSLVVLMAHRLHPEGCPAQQSTWYQKSEMTFSDSLAAVRRHLWGARNNPQSVQNTESCLIPLALWEQVQKTLAYAA